MPVGKNESSLELLELFPAVPMLNEEEEDDAEIESECYTTIPLHIARKNLSSMSRKRPGDENPLGDEMTLVQIGFIVSKYFEWSNQAVAIKSPVERSLSYFVENTILADCRVTIDSNVSFNVHRIVLECYSNYFDAHPNQLEVALPPEKVTEDAFECIYKWILSDADYCYDVIQRNKLLEILMAARFLQVTELEEQIIEVLQEEKFFCEETAYVLYLFAKGLDLPDVQELMLPRIKSFFLPLVSSKDFLDLDVCSLCAILRSNEIMVHNELEVFMSAVRWLRHGWPCRNEYVFTVLNTVRFGLIPAVVLVAIRRNTHSPEFVEIIKADPQQVNKLLDDGVAYTVTKNVFGSEGGFDMHTTKAGLEIPENRNWIKPNKSCESYHDFLVYLEKIREGIAQSSNTPGRRLVRGNVTGVGPRLKMLPMNSESGDGDSSYKKHEPMVDEFTLTELGFTISTNLEWEKLRRPFRKSRLYENIMNRLYDFVNADFTIKIEEKDNTARYQAHRILLNVYSRYFSNCSVADSVTLPSNEVSCQAFEIIYKWMLRDADEAHKVLRRDSLLEVYMAARYLQITELEALCYTVVSNKDFFREGSAFVLYLIAKSQRFRDIMDMMIPRIGEFFITLVSTQDYLELDVDDVCALLNSNNIVVNSEMEVFYSAIRWLRGNWISNQRHVFNVMSCVRFGFIPAIYIVEFKCNESLREIVGEPDVVKLIDNGLAYSVIKTKYRDNHELYAKSLSENYIMEPVPRNWNQDGEQYVGSYGDFLRYLHQKRKQYLDESRNEQILRSKQEKLDKQKFDQGNASHDLLSNKSSKHIRDWRDPTAAAAANNRSMRNLTSDSYPTYNCYPGGSPSPEPFEERGQFINKSKRTSQPMQQCPSFEDLLKKPQKARVTEDPPPPIRPSRHNSKTIRPSKTSSLNAKDRKSIGSSNITEASTFICSAQRSTTDVSLASQEHDTILVFGGVDPYLTELTKDSGRLIYRYSEGSNTWEVGGRMPEARCYHATIRCGDRVFVIGGTDITKRGRNGRSPIVPTVWSLDVHSKNWYREADLTFPRKSVGAVEIRGMVYVIGGVDGNGKILNTVERYNRKTRKWENGPPLTLPRYAHCVEFFKDAIWVVGGKTDQGITDNVERLQLTGHGWERMSALRYPRCYGAMIAMEETLYLLGGAQVQKEDVVSLSEVDVSYGASWNRRYPMSTPRHLHAVCALGTRILTIGGASTAFQKGPTEVESYCCKTRRKTRGIAPFPQPISAHQAVTVPRST